MGRVLVPTPASTVSITFGMDIMHNSSSVLITSVGPLSVKASVAVSVSKKMIFLCNLTCNYHFKRKTLFRVSQNEVYDSSVVLNK